MPLSAPEYWLEWTKNYFRCQFTYMGGLFFKKIAPESTPLWIVAFWKFNRALWGLFTAVSVFVNSTNITTNIETAALSNLPRCWYWLSWGWGDIVEIILQRVVFFCVGCGLLLYQSNYTTCKAPMNTDGKDNNGGGKNVTFQTYSLTCCHEQHSYHQRRIHTEESSSKARRTLKKIFVYYCHCHWLLLYLTIKKYLSWYIRNSLSIVLCTHSSPL